MSLPHCTRHGIIHQDHHGSIPAHDCVTAVGQVQDVANQAADMKKMAAVILLDQTAAFDLVPHNILLMKMKLLNFSSNILAWFSSYLQGRRFAVRV